MQEDHHLILPDETATAAFAGRMAAILRPGDTLLLTGEIGAGKTCFCRALIRARLGVAEDVPSPTFTLVQTYEAADGDIWHCDLYRLTTPQEVIELGLDDAFQTAICLVEWPDRLGPLAPDTALTLHFTARPDHHAVEWTAFGAWAARMAMLHV